MGRGVTALEEAEAGPAELEEEPEPEPEEEPEEEEAASELPVRRYCSAPVTEEASEI